MIRPHVIKSALFLMPIFVLSNCALSPEEKPAFDVVIASERIHFTGKGVGAGMMLSSSLGPMGIAVGIAIDEGIAKEIHQAFESEEGVGKLGDFIRNTVNRECSSIPSTTASFRFDRVGFNLSSGELARLSLKGSVLWERGENDIETLLARADLQSQNLSELKTNGALVADSIAQGVRAMCAGMVR